MRSNNIPSEEEAVASFLSLSNNYKKLIEIKKKSDDSKKSFLSFSCTYQMYHNLDPTVEYIILQLEKSKTFDELFRAISYREKKPQSK